MDSSEIITAKGTTQSDSTVDLKRLEKLIILIRKTLVKAKNFMEEDMVPEIQIPLTDLEEFLDCKLAVHEMKTDKGKYMSLPDEWTPIFKNNSVEYWLDDNVQVIKLRHLYSPEEYKKYKFVKMRGFMQCAIENNALFKEFVNYRLNLD